MTKLSYFWFPWCVWHYIPSFYNKKIAELIASGDHFDVRQVRGQIQLLVARNPNGGPYITKADAKEKGLI